MVVRVSKVKAFLWFLVIIFSALSFPLQVHFMSPFPSLIPYVIIIIILMLTFLTPRTTKLNHKSNISFIILIYVFLVLINTGWQTAFDVVPLFRSISGLAVYLLPVVFYFYFRRAASEKEIRAIIVAIFIAGLIGAIFFSYDSILKLVYHKVSDYAYDAFDYSYRRVAHLPKGVTINYARVAPSLRSHGLLEKHAVSGGYICLGAFAALALLPKNKKIYRLLVIVLFGSMLLIALNLTSIIAFVIIILLIEIGVLQFVQLKLSMAVFRKIILFSIVGTIVAVCIIIFSGEIMRGFMANLFAHQLGMQHETHDPSIRMGNIILRYITNYFHNIRSHTISLILGDGFGNFGMPKGGDFGLIESLARLGAPLFVIVIYGFFRLIRAGFRRIKLLSSRRDLHQRSLSYQNIIEFSICVTLLVLIMDCHYTIWSSKEILPIVFFTLALFDRYLNLPIDTP